MRVTYNFHLPVVSPAHAGMYRWFSTQSPTGWSFPRTRGDVPQMANQQLLGQKFPPHTRGCTWVARELIRFGGVSPAHAGMYPFQGLLLNSLPSFPRTRGDVPAPPSFWVKVTVFPPHTRGCTFDSCLLPFLKLVSPAHAGMYLRPWERMEGLPGFPRTRGDVPIGDRVAVLLSTFPPHTRGCTGDQYR